MTAMGLTAVEIAIFGSGCFWCTEALFEQLRGVVSVDSGYAGGTTPNPAYAEVCSGSTGHAEVLQIVFDPSVISYEMLLKVFFSSHDPTTRNRQGHDVGTQYRSVVFYLTNAQKKAAEHMIGQFNRDKVFENPIVTAVEPLMEFYPAEACHQNYYALHPDKPYCQMVINPKVQKLRKEFAALLKSTK